MDGFKKRLNESLQFKLSFSLSVAILGERIRQPESRQSDAHECRCNCRRKSLVFISQLFAEID